MRRVIDLPPKPWKLSTMSTLLMLTMLACGGFYAVAETTVPTLSVENGGPDPVAVLLDGRRIGTAMPGQTTCLALRWMDSSPSHVLSYRPLAGGEVKGPPETLLHSEGWSVKLGHLLRHDVFSLTPAPACRP